MRWQTGVTQRERREAEARIGALLVELLKLGPGDLDDPPPPGSLLSLAYRPRPVPPPD